MSLDIKTEDEFYQSAINSRNLEVDPDERGDADALIAGAWNDSETGMHLLRLQAEWESGQKPRKPTPEMIASIVTALKRAMPAQEQTAERAVEIAVGWYTNELSLFFLKLRSRRQTVWGLLHLADRQGLDRAIVVPVLHWWLAPTCIACGGHGYTQVPGTARLSGHTCPSCRGIGQKPLPHGKPGRQLASRLDDLASRANAEMHRRLKKFG